MTRRRELSVEEAEAIVAKLDAMPVPDRLAQLESVVGLLYMQVEGIATAVSNMIGTLEAVQKEAEPSPQSSGGYI